MSKTKLLLVGWDAADWAVVNPLLESGKLPALSTLMASGFKGRISSLNPMLSPLLWTSIATGRRAHNHGVLGFMEPLPDGTDVRAVRSSSRRVPAFWELLHERGIQSNVIGWWPSNPVDDSGGVSVSNFFTRDDDHAYLSLNEGDVHPSSLTEELSDLRVHSTELTASILAPFFPDTDEMDGSDPIFSSVARILSHALSVQAAATEAMERGPWDITAVYFDALDHFKHLAMKYHPPQMHDVSDEEYRKYHYIVEAAYRFHDMMLQRLLDLAGEDCHVLLVSDHGFAVESERMLAVPDTPGGPAAEHHPYGVLVGAGPQWKEGWVYGNSLLDIAPSILHLFEHPISAEMEGRVSHEWWKQYRSETACASYPERQVSARLSESIDERQLLKDLEQLGYVEWSNDGTRRAEQAEADWRYNEIASLLDGGQELTALQKCRALAVEYPNDPRFAYQLLALLQRLEPEEFDREWTAVTQKFPSLSADYFAGVRAVQKGLYEVANDHFNKVIDSESVSPAVKTAVADALFQVGRKSEASKMLQTVQKEYPRWPEAPALLAEWHYLEGEFEDAIDMSLTALERAHVLPRTHLVLARSARKLNQVDAAVAGYRFVLSFRPDDVFVKREAAAYFRELGLTLEAEQWEAELSEAKTITVVTGWPRSGTSMLMRCLGQAGYPLHVDEERQADDSNPHGYFEIDNVKRLHVQSEFLDQAVGKAIKVVFPQLTHLPPAFHYKVIWIDRPLTEVILSQEVMKGRSSDSVKAHFPFGKALQMESDVRRMEKWMDENPHVDVLKIQHRAFFESPHEVGTRVQAFLNPPSWNSSGFHQAIDLKLKRSEL